MTRPKIQVLLKVPMDPRPIQSQLEEAGYDPEIIEVRGGPVFAAAGLMDFVVDHLDEALIGVIVAMVKEAMSRARQPMRDRGVNVTIQHADSVTVINIAGDGTVTQHPKLDPEEE